MIKEERKVSREKQKISLFLPPLLSLDGIGTR